MPSLLAIAVTSAIAVAGLASLAAKNAAAVKKEPTRMAASTPDSKPIEKTDKK